MDEKPETQPDDRDEPEDSPDLDWDTLGRNIAARYKKVLAALAD